MAKRSRRLKLVTDEVDEVTEQQEAQPQPSMDEFVREMHGTTPEGEQSGLPTLEWLKSKFKTKSAAIRYLVLEQKHPVKVVAKHLGVRYQHVRNVVKNPLKRGPNEDFHLKPTDEEGSKASTVKSDD